MIEVESYIDAAGFESRVAAKLVQYLVKPPKCSELVNGKIVNHCKKGISPATCVQNNSVGECMLRRARIEVEHEEELKTLPCPECGEKHKLEIMHVKQRS